MKVGTLVRASAACVAVAAVAVLPAIGEDLKPRQVRNKGRKAGTAWQEGNVEQALALYDEIFAGTSGRVVPERGDALYALLVASLLPDSPRHDPDEAKALLDEYLESFPKHRRHQEVAVLRSLWEARILESEKATARLEEQGARVETLKAELSQATVEHEAEVESLRGQLAEAQKKLANANGVLKSIQDELAKKDEALEKLTRRVVGRSGDG